MNDSQINAEQIDYWNEVAGPKWVAIQEVLDSQIESFGLAMLDRVGLAENEHVLDIGCGCGAVTLEAARRVGPQGRVLGADISRVMLDRAEERVAAAEFSHVSFICDDAQTHQWNDTYDAVVSRFGVMFFSDPVAAFANIQKALKPQGRLSFICWRPGELNPWVTVPNGAVSHLLEMPAPPDAHAPGPFAFADGDRTRKILEEAGYSEIRVDPHDQTFSMGPGLSLEEGVRMSYNVGPLSRLMGEASQETKEAVHQALLKALEPYHSDAGIVFDSATWIVSAKA